MCSIHEMSTYHWENDTIAMLCQKLHALLELMLKQSCVETAENKIKKKLRVEESKKK